MAVDGGVAVPREVLGGGRDPGLLVPLHLGGDHTGHRVRVGAEGPYADHRVGRVDVHVGDGGVVLADAERVQFGAGDPAERTGVRAGAAGAEGHGTGEEGGGLAHAGDDAVLLVGGDEHRQAVRPGEGRLLDAVGEGGDLVRVAGVVRPGEVDDAADVVLLHQLGGGADAQFLEVGVDVGLVGCGGRVAVDPRDEELADLLLQAHPGDQGPQPVVVRNVGVGPPTAERPEPERGGQPRGGGEHGPPRGSLAGLTALTLDVTHTRPFRRPAEGNFRAATNNRKLTSSQENAQRRRARPVRGAGNCASNPIKPAPANKQNPPSWKAPRGSKGPSPLKGRDGQGRRGRRNPARTTER